MTETTSVSTDTSQENPADIREVTGLFMSDKAMQDTIRELEGSLFPRQDISVMGSAADLEKVFGAKTVPPEFAMDNSDTPRQAPSRPEEQTIGTAGLIGGSTYIGAMALAITAGATAFPAIIAAVALGGLGGGTAGAILAKLLGDNYKNTIAEQIEKGGLLLWVRAPDQEKDDLAKEIMIKNGGQEVHLHTIR